MKRVRLVSAGLLTVLFLAIGARASAQSNDEVFPQFQWNFSTPGARANAMGRAFIGVADDASASVTNPAGLIRLARPQAYIEFKDTKVDVNRPAAVDSLFTRQTTSFSSNVGSASFFSISAPLRGWGAVAFSRHEFLNYQETFQLAARPIPNSPNNSVLRGIDGSTDFSAAAYGGSFAATVKKTLHIGVTATLNHLDAQSLGTRYNTNFPANYPANQFGVTRSAVIANKTSISGTDNAPGATVGLFWVPNEKGSVGFQYTKGPHFQVAETLLTNDGFPNANTTFTTASGFPKTVSINVPDRFGVGFAYRPMDRLLAAFDVLRINYSSLAKDFTIVFNPTLTGTEFSVADATEAHFGAEYQAIRGKQSVFVRAGVFTSPGHVTRFAGTSDASTNSIESALYNILPSDTDVVGTVGLGAAIGRRLQLDLAYASSKEVVFSAGFRF